MIRFVALINRFRLISNSLRWSLEELATVASSNSPKSKSVELWEGIYQRALRDRNSGAALSAANIHQAIATPATATKEHSVSRISRDTNEPISEDGRSTQPELSPKDPCSLCFGVASSDCTKGVLPRWSTVHQANFFPWHRNDLQCAEPRLNCKFRSSL